MIIIHGDLIKVVEKYDFDVVLHCCNCFNTMGAGVALAIAKAWPEAMEVDQLTKCGDVNKLGKFSSAEIHRGNRMFTVFNIYGQYHYGARHLRLLDMSALHKALLSINMMLEHREKPAEIIFPRLGAGNAGGKWSEISALLEDIFSQHKLTLVSDYPVK